MGGAGLLGRRGLEELRQRDRMEREAKRSARRTTSSRTSEVSVCSELVSEIDATVGVATSITLSAMSASLWRSMEESVEARTTLTLAGRRWRKSSRMKELASADVPSLSPRSCCIRHSNCVGFLSPSSSPLISCWSFLCSEAAVRLMSSVLRMS